MTKNRKLRTPKQDQHQEIPGSLPMHTLQEWDAWDKHASMNLHSYYENILGKLLIEKNFTSDDVKPACIQHLPIGKDFFSWKKKPAPSIKDYWLFAFLCPLTGEVFKNPVKTRYGDRYESKAIRKLLKKRPRDPFTHYRLTEGDLTPDDRLLEYTAKLKPHYRMNDNTKAGLKRLKQKLIPVFRKIIFYNALSTCFRFLAPTSLGILVLTLVFLSVTQNSYLQTAPEIIKNWAQDSGSLFLKWAHEQEDSFKLLLPLTAEEKNSLSHCKHYDENTDLMHCKTTWLYSIKHQNIDFLHKLCQDAGDSVCMQIAMMLNFTDDETFLKMDTTHYSGTLRPIKANLPLTHAVWERDVMGTRRLLPHINPNVKNQFNLTPLVAFMLGHIFQRLTYFDDESLLKHALQMQFLLRIKDANTQQWTYYRPYYKHANSIRKDLFILGELLARGASLEATDSSGRTALAIARQYKRTPMINMLVEAELGQINQGRLNIAKSYPARFFPENKAPAKVEIYQNEDDVDIDESLEEIPEAMEMDDFGIY